MCSPCSILVIDSSKESNWVYKKKLRKFCNSVSVYNEIKDAVTLITAGLHYDVILLKHNDNFKQEAEGYKALREAGYKGSIVIVAAGNGLDKILGRYKGVTGIISKYTNETDFCSQLKNILDDKIEEGISDVSPRS